MPYPLIVAGTCSPKKAFVQSFRFSIEQVIPCPRIIEAIQANKVMLRKKAIEEIKANFSDNYREALEDIKKCKAHFGSILMTLEAQQ